MPRVIARTLICALMIFSILGLSAALVQAGDLNSAYSACKRPCEEFEMGAKYFCCNGGCDAAKNLADQYKEARVDAWKNACYAKRTGSQYCQQARFVHHWDEACNRLIDRYSSQ